MKTLFLLRHAKSSWGQPSLDDFDRPLNERGRMAGLVMGEHINSMKKKPELAICSSAMRARETLQRLQEALDEEIPVRFEDDLYLASPKEMLKILRQTDDAVSSVMLIAHNPGMHMLALDLADNCDNDALDKMQMKYPTAGLAVLTSDADSWLAFNSCRLDSFTRPKDLAANC